MKLLDIINTDCKRYGISKISIVQFIKIFYIHAVPGLKFLIIFRTLQYYRKKNKLLFSFFFLWYRHLKVKYGFDISYRTTIGNGLYLGHFGGVVIHGDSVIGNNCNISQGVTIGVNNYGKNKGVPTIGNEVFIGPNACIFGAITIGNNVTIGANTVVNNSVQANKTIVATSSIEIDKDLSSYYIQNK